MWCFLLMLNICHWQKFTFHPTRTEGTQTLIFWYSSSTCQLPLLSPSANSGSKTSTFLIFAIKNFSFSFPSRLSLCLRASREEMTKTLHKSAFLSRESKYFFVQIVLLIPCLLLFLTKNRPSPCLHQHRIYISTHRTYWLTSQRGWVFVTRI